MAIGAEHPEYTELLPYWKIDRDLYKGELHVKNLGIEYLPATAGMIIDGMKAGQVGLANYNLYLSRALFHDFYKDAVEALIGIMHQKETAIDLPKELEPLRNNATATGESLVMLLRRINEEQLTTGRTGLQADMPGVSNVKTLPFIAMYCAEAIRNWNEIRLPTGEIVVDFLCLDETKYVMDEESFSWSLKEQYFIQQLIGGEVFGKVFDETTGYDKTLMTKTMRQGKALDKIPFVFINSKDLLASPDTPPLQGLAQLVLSIYRSEADYRFNLFMQGQDTLVIKGGISNPNAVAGIDDDAVRTGAGCRIDVDAAGDAKYIGVTSQGLSEQRLALEADKKAAETKAGSLSLGKASQQESGDALGKRVAAQTATLKQIALTGAAGLETMLKRIAVWVGADPDKVKVTANSDFADNDIKGQELVYLMTAKAMGYPLSQESLHKIAVERGLTLLDLETELKLIADEMAKLTPDQLAIRAAAAGLSTAGNTQNQGQPTSDTSKTPTDTGTK